MSDPVKPPIWKRAVHRFLNDWQKRRNERAIHYDRDDGELLRFAFTDPLVLEGLIHEPVQSIEALSQQIDSLFLPVDSFWNGYEEIRIGEWSEHKGVVTLHYSLGGFEFISRCYCDSAEGSNASLLIPGSGVNQSSAIRSGGSNNYHGDIYPRLQKKGAAFLFVKPNEDCLAIHNGYYKLHPDFYINALLNRGGSYSARYICDTMAWIKALKERYGKVDLYGLSQGGAAAFYAALQAEPNNAFIAAGFSALSERLLWSGHGQVVIPGIDRVYPVAGLADRLALLKTQFHLFFGEQDWGTFKLDGAHRITASLFDQVGNVAVATHSGGHCFPAL